MPMEYLDLRSVWFAFSFVNKAFLLFFCAVSVYTLSLSLRGLLLLHTFKRARATDNAGSAIAQVGVLRKRMVNLRQLHLFTLYLLGFCISIQVPNAFITLGSSKNLEVSTILRNLTFLFYYDALVFLAFLVLHTIQWLVSRRADSFVAGNGE
jgi:hypothetical protein